MLFCVIRQQINSADAYSNLNNQEHLKASENAKAIYVKAKVSKNKKSKSNIMLQVKQVINL